MRSRDSATRSYLLAVRRLMLASAVSLLTGLALGAIGGGLLVLLSPVAGDYWARTSASTRVSIGALFTLYLALCGVWLPFSLTDGGGYTWHAYADMFSSFAAFIIPSGLVGIMLASSVRVRNLVQAMARTLKN
jgi:hypothetical protein